MCARFCLAVILLPLLVSCDFTADPNPLPDLMADLEFVDDSLLVSFRNRRQTMMRSLTMRVTLESVDEEGREHDATRVPLRLIPGELRTISIESDQINLADVPTGPYLPVLLVTADGDGSEIVRVEADEPVMVGLQRIWSDGAFPPVPEGWRAAGIAADTVTLNWSSPPGAEFEIQRAVGGGAFDTFWSGSAEVVIDTTVTSRTSFRYRLRCTVDGYQSDFSRTLQIRTPATFEDVTESDVRDALDRGTTSSIDATELSAASIWAIRTEEPASSHGYVRLQIIRVTTDDPATDTMRFDFQRFGDDGARANLDPGFKYDFESRRENRKGDTHDILWTGTTVTMLNGAVIAPIDIETL